MKKLLAIILSITVALTMGMAVTTTAFAAATDNVSVTVTGVKEGNTLKLYKIADASVGSDNAIHYTMAEGLPADYDTPEEIGAVEEAADVEAMANAFAAVFGGKTATYSSVAGSNNTATASVAPGYYFAIISGNADTGIIYKSMLINAVPQVSGNSYVAHDPVSIEAKHTTEKVTKTEPDPTTAAASAHSTDGYRLGDSIPFTITTTIPNYPSNAAHATFVIKDAPQGLKDDLDSVQVKVGTDTVSAGNDTFSIDASGDGFTITFVKAYILAHPGADVVVTYNGKLTGPVTLAGGTQNTASIEYNPNPYEETTVKPDDTDIQTTYGLVFEKVDENGATLENAVFALYDSEGNAVKDANGNAMTFTTAKQTIGGTDHTYVWFEGLSAGTYTIKETAAPAGYVTVADFTMNVGASVSTADNPATVDKTETNYTVLSSKVENEKGVDLPSTGGMGTTILYILGALLVIGCGIVLIARRRMTAR